ncbi:Hypothetical protein Minf_1747 [Methylacidiphilum infernorum V4]|uniref:Uncharacterized protein n=1 Tax=Methylacidiphilum infernorum (isolate V4) TaxID=481448 RepID=B3DX92_METI4|nr:Hypothetical protein Minf_1747 [Methylacidiphilum infernorum V4]
MVVYSSKGSLMRSPFLEKKIFFKRKLEISREISRPFYEYTQKKTLASTR